jgi:cytochrome P450
MCAEGRLAYHRSMPLSAIVASGLHTLSAVRSSIAMMSDPLRFLDLSAQRGDVVPIELSGGLRLLLICHPEDVHGVLVANRRFPKRHPFLAEMRRFVGDGLATSDGELWRKQRRLVQRAFSRERVVAYADEMTALAAGSIERWRPGEVRDLYADCMRFVLEGTARTFFSMPVGDEARDVVDAVSVVMDRFANPLFMYAPALDKLPLPSAKRLQKAQRRLDQIIDGMIAARRGRPDSPEGDLLGALLASRDEDGSAMSDRRLHDEVITLYIAGYEPTAVALAWTFHLLSTHPSAMARAAEEARAVLAGRVATHEDVARLPSIQHAIDESLRLYPPAWTSVREADEPCEIRGHAVPAGAYIWMSPWIVHRDPRWFDAPGQFRPERWADGLAERLPRGAYFPYGAGPRMCVGAPLASELMPQLVATILSRFRVEPVKGRSPKPYPSINLRPRDGVWVRLGAW